MNSNIVTSDPPQGMKVVMMRASALLLYYFLKIVDNLFLELIQLSLEPKRLSTNNKCFMYEGRV